MAAPPIRAVLFDAYGTLAHIRHPTHPYRQLLRIVREQRSRVRPKYGSREMLCRPLDLVAAAQLYGVDLSVSQQQDLERDLNVEVRSLALFPEVLRVLRTLRARGYRIGVCSNLAQPYVRPIAELLCDVIDTAVWSCEVGLTKPDPAIYDLAASRLGFPPATVLMVGDSRQADVEGPRSAGLHALHLDRRSGAGDLSTLQDLLSCLS